MRQRSHPDPEDRVAIYRSIRSGIAALPSVEAATLSIRTRFAWQMSGWQVEGEDTGNGSIRTTAVPQVVGPDYFRTLRADMLSGRAFADEDRSQSEPVAIVARRLAERLWPGEDPLGMRVRDTAGGMAGGEGETAVWRRVVGVADDLRYDLSADPHPEYYIPYAQAGVGNYMSVMVRLRPGTAPPLGAIGSVVRRHDPTIAVEPAAPLADSVEAALRPHSFIAGLLGTFALFAYLLAVMGLYAAVSYTVSQSTRAVAVRMALGADGGRVVRHFMGQGLTVITAGTLLGLAGASAAAGVLANRLVGVPPVDPATYAAAAGLLALSAAVAVLVPSLRAARTHPMQVLREE
jgi:hypothetical protein